MRRLVPLAVSLTILLVIYRSIDTAAMLDAFRRSSPLWLIVGLALVVPLTALTSFRLQRLMPAGTRLPFREALGLTLSASVLNMVLPSKMGDIAKGWFIRERGHLRGSLALALVVFEKACDLLALLAWCVVGLAFLPRERPWVWMLALALVAALGAGMLMLGSARFAARLVAIGRRVAPVRMLPQVQAFGDGWAELQRLLRTRSRRSLEIAATSLFIWFLHLLQIWIFILALRAWVPFTASVALAPLAILAGLAPLTFAGIGTRDAALIVLFQYHLTAATAAALGVLCTLRYLMPAIAGLPFFGRYLQQIRLVAGPAVEGGRRPG